MKVVFDHSQEMLRKILALKDAQQDIVVICPDCGGEIAAVEVKDRLIRCEKCGFVAKLNVGPKSKHELVWEEFNKLNRPE